MFQEVRRLKRGGEGEGEEGKQRSDGGTVKRVVLECTHSGTMQLLNNADCKMFRPRRFSVAKQFCKTFVVTTY